MPLDATCPRCSHSFPVTEARHPVTVACPRCEAELTAEFKRPAAPPDAGQPHYELHVAPGALPGTVAPPPVPRRKKEDDEDEPTRKGGSALVVLLSGGVGLLFVIGGLSLTGWFLFTQIDVEPTSSASTRSGSSGRNTNNPKGSGTAIPGAKGTPSRPNPAPDPFVPPPFVPPTKPPETFDLRPVVGTPPPITAPELPSDPSNADLNEAGLGKVGQIAVGGGGRYLVMHFPEKGKLGLFDVSQAKLFATESDAGEVKLAAGLSRAVVYVPGANVLRVYELPGLRKMYEGASPLGGLDNIAMGSRTDGPLLCLGWPSTAALVELGPTDLKEVEGARKEHLGLHGGMLRAAPDGLAFTTFDGFHPHNKTTLLTVSGRQWKVQKDIPAVPFPGTDGNLYGNGVVLDRSARDQRFGGIGAGSGQWYVPAVSGSGQFLKVIPQEVGKGFDRKWTFAVTVHANRNAGTAAVNTNLSALPEFENLVEWTGRQPAVPLDKHLFLVPEAKLLVTLTANKDRLVLRRVDIR